MTVRAMATCRKFRGRPSPAMGVLAGKFHPPIHPSPRECVFSGPTPTLFPWGCEFFGVAPYVWEGSEKLACSERGEVGPEKLFFAPKGARGRVPKIASAGDPKKFPVRTRDGLRHPFF